MLRPTLPLAKHSAGSHFVWILLRKHHALQCLPVTMLGKDQLQLATQRELESQQRGWSRHSTPTADAWGSGDNQHLSSSSRQEDRQAHVPTARTNCCLCTHRHTNMHKHAHRHCLHTCTGCVSAVPACAHTVKPAHRCKQNTGSPVCLHKPKHMHRAVCLCSPKHARSAVCMHALSMHTVLSAQHRAPHGLLYAQTRAHNNLSSPQGFQADTHSRSRAAGTGPVPGGAEQSRGTAACPELPSHTHSQTLSLAVTAQSPPRPGYRWALPQRQAGTDRCTAFVS